MLPSMILKKPKKKSLKWEVTKTVINNAKYLNSHVKQKNITSGDCIQINKKPGL